MITHQVTPTKQNKSYPTQTHKIMTYAIFTLFSALLLLQVGCSKPTTEEKQPPAINQKQALDKAETAPQTKTMVKTETPNPNESKTDLTVNDEDKKSIIAFVNEWKMAWQKSASASGDINKYFSFYADTFKTNSSDFSQWKKSKTIRNQGKSWIEVWISDIDINTTQNGQFEVTFNQEYSSSNYADKGRKQLILSADESGWKITSEQDIK